MNKLRLRLIERDVNLLYWLDLQRRKRSSIRGRMCDDKFLEGLEEFIVVCKLSSWRCGLLMRSDSSRRDFRSRGRRDLNDDDNRRQSARENVQTEGRKVGKHRAGCTDVLVWTILSTPCCSRGSHVTSMSRSARSDLRRDVRLKLFTKLLLQSSCLLVSQTLWLTSGRRLYNPCDKCGR